MRIMLRKFCLESFLFQKEKKRKKDKNNTTPKGFLKWNSCYK